MKDDNTDLSELTLATPGQRLKYIRNMLRLTRAYLHEKYNLSTDSLNAWESGKLKLTPKALDRCIKIYNKEGIFVSKNWILTGEGLAPKLSISIANYFQTPTPDSQGNFADLTDDELILREVDFFKQTTPNAVVMLVSNDEMLPLYEAGDYVGGRFQSSDFIHSCLGKDCIIETLDGEKYFRRLSAILPNGLCNLSCLNPNDNLEPVLFNIKVAMIAPVIWHRRKDKN
ncbi:MAG: helix-turn-helix transcriptional regulator [Gammaproteobacteria bacterium]